MKQAMDILNAMALHRGLCLLRSKALVLKAVEARDKSMNLHKSSILGSSQFKSLYNYLYVILGFFSVNERYMCTVLSQLRLFLFVFFLKANSIHFTRRYK